jgi:hypothetical protein
LRHRGTIACALAVASAALSAAVPAAADRDPSSAHEELHSELAWVRAVLGKNVRQRAGGLYEIRAGEGRTLLTHGPDPAPVSGPRRRGASTGPERPPACGGDRHTHFLLALPRAREVRSNRVRHRAARAVRQANGLLNESSREEGGPTADLETRCDKRGRIAFPTLRYRRLDFASLVRLARQRGFDRATTDYLIMVRGKRAESCGAASFEGDERLSAINVNNVRGGYAVVYRPCWMGEDLLHEIGHLQGAVQYRAPYSTGFGRHCWDEADVMCYTPDGGDLHQAGTISRCRTVSFDCGHDTYFDPTPETGEWLSAHWNLGSPVNAFIRFGPR